MKRLKRSSTMSKADQDKARKRIKTQTYKCGHKQKAVIIDDNELSITAYMEWKETVGFEGTNEMCWDCWCKSQTAGDASRGNMVSGNTKVSLLKSGSQCDTKTSAVTTSGSKDAGEKKVYACVYGAGYYNCDEILHIMEISEARERERCVKALKLRYYNPSKYFGKIDKADLVGLGKAIDIIKELK